MTIQELKSNPPMMKIKLHTGKTTLATIQEPRGCCHARIFYKVNGVRTERDMEWGTLLDICNRDGIIQE